MKLLSCTPGGTVYITLSRRNLTDLLAELDSPYGDATARKRLDDGTLLMVGADEDFPHYGPDGTDADEPPIAVHKITPPGKYLIGRAGHPAWDARYFPGSSLGDAFAAARGLWSEPVGLTYYGKQV